MLQSRGVNIQDPGAFVRLQGNIFIVCLRTLPCVAKGCRRGDLVIGSRLGPPPRSKPLAQTAGVQEGSFG